MVPEPLPKDDPLWDAKNLILTPHVSGNMTLGYTCDRNVELFCADLTNYAAGRPLQGLVTGNGGIKGQSGWSRAACKQKLRRCPLPGQTSRQGHDILRVS